MNELQRKLLVIFRAESKEHLEKMRQQLETLEGRQGDPRGSDLDEIFRRAHSLKGAARAVDLGPIERLAHSLETLFSRIQAGSVSFEKVVLKTIFQTLDTIEDGINAVYEDRLPSEQPEVIAAVYSILGEAASQQNEPKQKALEVSQEQEIKAAPTIPDNDDTVRVSLSSLDRLMRTAGQLITGRMYQDLITKELEPIAIKVSALEKECDRIKQSNGGQRSELSKENAVKQAADYHQCVALHVKDLTSLIGTVMSKQRQSSWTLNRLGEELNENVREVRMVPAESVFGGFRKMVRDLARDEGRELDFKATGLEVEADRLVLQALKDPVMHILRNAITHGIELPGLREKSGKPRLGSIQLKIAAQGSRLQITITDDGKGIDFQAVSKLAVKKGILTEEQTVGVSQETLAEIVFQPWFSTAAMVTDLAGRGMGLSIVAEALHRLQGEVKLSPVEGGGASMHISVPLSLSSQRLLLVRVKGQTYAIPVYSIEKLLNVKLHEVSTFKGKPALYLEKEPIPFVTLSQLLKLGEAPLEVEGEIIPVAILKGSGKRLAVAVDSFESEIDSILKDLGAPFPRAKTLSGGILQPDGSVVLVLNPAALLQMKLEAHLIVIKKEAPAQKQKEHRILVCDDSITTRTLEKTILETQGYQVILAVDGVDALEKMKIDQFDLIIVDVQMPRMDGFTLIEEMKKDARLKEKPVIIVSSLDKKEDKERGLTLGANAYIVKGKFDHQVLLETVRQII